MSKIYVDAVEPEGASTVLTLGSATDTIQIPGGGAGASKVLTSDATGGATWAAPASANNTPMFSAYLSSNQNLADATYEKVQFDTISVTDGGTYDNTTNFDWTPGVAGVYVLKCNLGLYHAGGHQTDMEDANIQYYLNGSAFVPELNFPNTYGYTQNTMPGWVHLQADAVVTLSATDSIHVMALINHTWTTYQNYVKGDRASYFASYKLIGS